MTMQESLAVTISALDPAEIDAAAVALAEMYARQLDLAAIVANRAEKAVRDANRTGDEALIEEMAALRAKLGERECVDRIGARFHALLAELKATPKARGDEKPGRKAAGTLPELRAAR